MAEMRIENAGNPCMAGEADFECKYLFGCLAVKIIRSQ